MARQLVKKGLARRAEIQVAYAIGVEEPVSVKVDTFGSGDHGACESFVKGFDFRPRAIIERLDLLRPISAKRLTTGILVRLACRGRDSKEYKGPCGSKKLRNGRLETIESFGS